MRSCICINGRTKALPYRVCAMHFFARGRHGCRGTDKSPVGETFRLPRAIRDRPYENACAHPPANVTAAAEWTVEDAGPYGFVPCVSWSADGTASA